MGLWGRALALSVVGLSSLASAAAQTPPAQSAAPARDGVQVFDPAFFARYSPVSAADMVRQVPGFSINSGDNVRGFGAAAGNVLINSQRPSSKYSISEELGRIAAKDVLRIELIKASAAGDIDVRGYSELANVVLKPVAETQETTLWTAGLVYQDQERLSERLTASRSWKGDKLSVRLQGQISSSLQNEHNDVTRRNAFGALTQHRVEDNQTNLGEIMVNGSINWAASPFDTVNLNGQLMPRTYSRDVISEGFLPSGALRETSIDDYTEKDILHAELGGDWEHRFSAASSVKLVLLNRAVTWRPQQLFSTYGVNGSLGVTRINSEQKTGEHVARGVWTLKPGGGHTVESGVEAAFNYLDQHRAMATASGGGAFAPVTLPVSTTRVEELRGDAFISDTWVISPQLTLESAFNFEISRITQTGDATQERDFTYPKPRIALTWAPDRTEQWRLALKRDVAQLNFNTFASNVQLISSQLTIGNPDLRPAQTTELRLDYKKQFLERGSLNLSTFYNDVKDVQDFVPIRLTDPACAGATLASSPACYFTAAGNIGDGERWGATVSLDMPLDGLGVSGSLLKLGARVTDSRVTDPVTGHTRRFAGEATSSWNLDFRQDLPELKLAWGFDYASAASAGTYRLDEYSIVDPGDGDLDAFVQTTLMPGVTLNFGAENIFEQEQPLDRRFYSPNRLGPPSGSELRNYSRGRIYTLTLSGQF